MPVPRPSREELDGVARGEMQLLPPFRSGLFRFEGRSLWPPLSAILMIAAFFALVILVSAVIRAPRLFYAAGASRVRGGSQARKRREI